MADDFNVDIMPSVTTYELYQIASYTHWFAIGEFIDNSITSAFLNWEELLKLYGGKYQLNIEIDFDNDAKTLTIIDNAAGIARDEIQRALRAGEPPADRSLLSVHGVGMKMSSFWMGRNLNIKTWPLNVSLGYEVSVDLDEIKRTKSAITPVYEIPKKQRPGTVITLSKINDEKLPKGTGVAKLKLLLTSMYRLYLTNTDQRVNIKFNGKSLVFKNPEILNVPFWPDREGPLNEVSVRWEREFTYTSSKGQMVFGKVGLLETMSRDLSGFMLHYKGKGMGGIGAVDSSEEISQQDVRDAREYYRPSRIFGQEGSYRYQRFTGVFDISDLGKTSSTDSIKWGPDDEHDFIDALVEFLKDPKFNMWAMAENYQPRKALKLKEANEKPNVSNFSVEEVVTLSDYFNTHIHGEEILHPESEEEEIVVQEGPRSLNKAPQEDFVSTRNVFSVPDARGHMHHFEPQFIDNPEFDLFYLNSSSEDKHEIRINIGHPFLRRLQWGNPDVREAIIQMIYLMSVPEVFLPLRNSRSAYRSKINEIVDATLTRLNKSNGDNDAS
jgi:hypothetical protein